MADGLTRAQLVDAAGDLNDVLRLIDEETDPSESMGIDVTKPVSRLRKQVVDAGALIDGSKDDVDRLAPGTVLVLAALRDEILTAVPSMREKDIKERGMEAIEEEVVGALDQIAERASELRENGTVPEGDVVEASPSPKARIKKSKAAKTTAKAGKAPANAPEKKKPERKVFLARFRKVRRGTHFAKVLEAALAARPGSTIADVAQVAGLSAEKTEAALTAARRTNGIDHEVADDGTLTIILPKGVDVESVWHQPKTVSVSKKERGAAAVRKNGEAKPRSQYVIDPEDIAAGRLPKRAPIVTSQANVKQVQPKFDILHKMARTGDWKGVRDYKVGGSNAYAKYVARYREDLLSIHMNAQAG